MEEDLATENVEVSGLELAHNHLELRIVQEGRREFRVPFFEAEMRLSEQVPALFEGLPWRVKLEDERALLYSDEKNPEHLLAPGDSAIVEGSRVWLVDVRRPPLAELEGTTPRFVGRVWQVKDSQCWVGRAGKRLNHIELNHATVSRTHATFLPEEGGRVSLLPEASASPTTVNGEVVPAGEKVELGNGDLLGFGKMMFRFTCRQAAEPEANRLFVQTLEGFKVSLGNEGGPPVEIKNEKAGWLLAILACNWGDPVAVEPLLERFWPDVTGTRGRKNLSYSLGQLKEAFKDLPLEFSELLIRTPTVLTLERRFLGEHDFLEVKKLVEGGKAITSESMLRRLLKLYTGPFLPVCYEDWAERIRATLHNEVLKTLKASARYFLSEGSHQATVLAAEKCLKLEPHNEEAAELLMESYLIQAKPEKAVNVYQRMERTLKRDSLEPSVGLVKLFHRARLGL